MANHDYSPSNSALQLDLSRPYQYGHCFGRFHRIPLTEFLSVCRAAGATLQDAQWRLATPHVITCEQQGRIMRYQVQLAETALPSALARSLSSTITPDPEADRQAQQWLYLPGALDQAPQAASLLRLQGAQARHYKLQQVLFWLQEMLANGQAIGPYIATPCVYVPLLGGPVIDATRAFAKLARLEIQGQRPLQALSFVRIRHGRLQEGVGALVTRLPLELVCQQLPDHESADWLIWQRQTLIRLQQRLHALLQA